MLGHRQPDGLPQDPHLARYVTGTGQAYGPERALRTAGFREDPREDDPGPLRIAWQSRWLLLAVAIAVGASTFLLSARTQPIFAAETTLAFPAPGTAFGLAGGDADRARSLRTETARITSLALLSRAAARLDGTPPPRELLPHVKARPATDADVITIRATASTGARAVAVADAVADAYQAHVDERLQRRIDSLRRRVRTLSKRVDKQQGALSVLLDDSAAVEKDGDSEQRSGNDPAVSAARLRLEATVAQLADLQTQLDQTRADGAGGGTVQILLPAAAPEAPERPRPVRDAATAVILAVLGLVTVRWWRADPLPPTLRSADAAAALLDSPVIAEVPHLGCHAKDFEIVTGRSPEVLDAYRMVTMVNGLRGSVLVTTAGADETCSSLARNLAAVLARDGHRALVVEGSGGRQHAAAHSRGITDLVVGDARTTDSIRTGDVDRHSRIELVPWGSGPRGALRHPKADIAGALGQLTDLAEVVLIDGPSLISSPDALTWATQVDAILLVVTIDTPQAALSRLRSRLDHLDRPVLGVVVQHAPATGLTRRRRRVDTRAIDWEYPAAAISEGAHP